MDIILKMETLTSIQIIKMENIKVTIKIQINHLWFLQTDV